MSCYRGAAYTAKTLQHKAFSRDHYLSRKAIGRLPKFDLDLALSGLAQVITMHDSIEYYTIPELGEDRPMFRCERRKASLQVASCAGMWREANQRECPERLERCRGCSLGAVHAGEGDISTCPITGTDICTRCDRGGMRLVRDEICVSCWNREREWIIGKNAKGAPPKMHPPLYPMSIRVMAGDEIKVFSSPHCASTTELVVRALRDCRKQVLFSFAGVKPV